MTPAEFSGHVARAQLLALWCTTSFSACSLPACLSLLSLLILLCATFCVQRDHGCSWGGRGVSDNSYLGQLQGPWRIAQASFRPLGRTRSASWVNGPDLENELEGDKLAAALAGQEESCHGRRFPIRSQHCRTRLRSCKAMKIVEVSHPDRQAKLKEIGGCVTIVVTIVDMIVNTRSVIGDR